MNKVITDGITLMPDPFADGLANWSSENGRPGDATYDVDPNATLVAADADFGTCLELQKTSATQKIRSRLETPILPGCYLRISTRVKALSGALPDIRIAGWAGRAGGQELTGVPLEADSVTITQYGEVYEISAIVGKGHRLGVDLSWGADALFGHFGIDLTGPDGGVLRVEDIQIEDVTSVFLRKMINVVDVQDYGAIGDGVTDCRLAFEAADADANGRDILVPEGVYYLANTVTINNSIRFEGRITMPDDAVFQVTSNYEYRTYEDAFGNEELALRKAIQALLSFTDHDILDLNGRTISVYGPIDFQQLSGGKSKYSNRRIIQNGEINAESSSNWDTITASSSASYDYNADRTKLTNVSNVAQLVIGMLVEGTGVGREIYVRDIDEAAQEVTLSAPLYGAPASQNYSFTRFKYIFDFSGFDRVQGFVVQNVDFHCRGRASTVILARDGNVNYFMDCIFRKPKDRGITSPGESCKDIHILRNQFISNEEGLAVPDRTTVALNVNGNDAKIIGNRATRFKHFAFLGGSSNMVLNNHFFQGDDQATGIKTAGLILTTNYVRSIIDGNYIDNCWIEWGNEHTPTPNGPGSSFAGLAITNNIFMSIQAANWFRWIKVKPYNPDHYFNGLSVSGNVFMATGGTSIDRVEELDESIATMRRDQVLELSFMDNSYTAVSEAAISPVTVRVERSSASADWDRDLGEWMPFGLPAKHVTAIVPEGPIETNGGSDVFTMPFTETRRGTNETGIRLNWSQSVRGKVNATVRVDSVVN